MSAIRLVFFAKLREELGTAGETLEVPAGVVTVAALRAHLAGRGGAWAQALAPNRAVRVAVNHDVADDGTAIGDGDEVAFFPPVTGG